MATVLLLTISNVFMTFAWYGHLKYKSAPMWTAILVSWLIAFFEYCFQVPANRIGHLNYTATQLKIMQEVITLVVFCCFAVFYLHEPMRWNYIVGFLCILAAVVFVFGFQPARGTESTLSATSSASQADDVSLDAFSDGEPADAHRVSMEAKPPHP